MTEPAYIRIEFMLSILRKTTTEMINLKYLIHRNFRADKLVPNFELFWKVRKNKSSRKFLIFVRENLSALKLLRIRYVVEILMITWPLLATNQSTKCCASCKDIAILLHKMIGVAVGWLHNHREKVNHISCYRF